ncbi:MAG: hypothetical protein CSA42_00405 [Gammaproteobacteria bacterium]|nr:MAG: hypothetical protein CSB21_00105 [Deltaproteobacteria bacterium]PIE48148.1 MAG: hypothetical protein CSA42_00405 [Gammaproteobacteria bacterium]
MDSKIRELESEELREIIAGKKEKNFSIIDVREDFEYNSGHIVGANWIRLSDVEKNPDLVPDSKEVIFYCRSGARSLAAAKIFEESAKSEKTDSIRNLTKGMLGWDGATLPEPPRIDLFKGKKTFEDLLSRAMEFEKGAYLFYSAIYEKYNFLPYSDTIRILKKAETAHAKILFRNLGKPMDQFDSYFENIQGEIMESGITVEEALGQIESFSENICIDLLELLINIEASAYDLYKVLAQKNESTKSAFLTIAQEEKAHMRSIASSFILCA